MLHWTADHAIGDEHTAEFQGCALQTIIAWNCCCRDHTGAALFAIHRGEVHCINGLKAATLLSQTPLRMMLLQFGVQAAAVYDLLFYHLSYCSMA